MDEKELEFDLEDIIQEFSGQPEPDADFAEQILVQENLENENLMEEITRIVEQTERMIHDSRPPIPSDTIRLDTAHLPKGEVHNAAPLEEDEPEEAPPAEEPFTGEWEPEYEQPMGDYIPPQPIIFHPHSRLRELKRKLVAGPEKRYYALSEKGLGRLQAAIFVSVLVALISAFTTVMYALGVVQENRMRLMIFGQFLAMLVSALLGSFQLIEGVSDLFHKRFSLNTLLVFTFIACCVDGVVCLEQKRVPCCAAFSLEVTMSLWNTYERRNTEMGMMDTMRKANHLDSIAVSEDYYQGRKGFLRGEGQVEDFMDTYAQRSKPEKTLSAYAMIALFVSLALGVFAGVTKGIAQGIQVTAVALLAAMPATGYIATSRPMAVLERRLHALGTVLCGWKGVEGLCGKAVFPLNYEDLFPAGTVRMNGVKFFGNRQPDEIVAYCTAVIVADDSGLEPLFTQVLDSRNGRHYDAENLRAYSNGGIGGEVEGEAVLVGPLSFLREMGVEVPDGIRVNQAVCVAINGELCGLFAVSYEKAKSSVSGLSTLCGYRGLNPILTAGDFTLTDEFIHNKFGVNTRRMIFPERTVREELKQKELEPDAPALLLTTKEGLAPLAYGVTGARSLRTANKLGVAVHMTGGILGLLIMAVLVLLDAIELLTPMNMFLYQLVWMIPGFLITQWTSSL